MAERLWVKLWQSWWTGPSHAEVSADGLYVGAVLMMFVRWAPGSDDAWAVSERGKPIATSTIALRAKLKTPRVVAALRELEDAGTIAIRSDGAWGFPKFGRWQESASASKMRRSRSGHSAVTVTEDVTPLAEGEAEAVSLRESIVPFGDSPQRSEPNAGAEPEPTPVAQVLTHPTADAAAGRVASQRRRAAVELWDWHEGERVRRLLAGSHKPRCATDKSLGPVLRLHTHVRKAYQCSEAEAWSRIRAYREARLAETEAALREGNPKAEAWRSYAAGEAAWSHKGFDYLEQRGPDPRAAKAAADAEFAAEVQRRKRAQGTGGDDA